MYRDALKALDGYEMDGRPITIVFAKENRKTPDQMRPRDDGRSRDRQDDRGRRSPEREEGSRYFIERG
jgi:hypothetical protein